ncbi:MAG TPA: glycosyltransferase family 4 protein [Gammaproteobacteria bacterium]|nr:glycosyltransferase family 4 protein [Gammaproteobacteria bacterium]
MKVIHVETGMHLYGGALQVFFLLRGLQPYPGEHILVCPSGSAIGKAAREFVRVVEIPCRGDHDLAFLWRLQRLLRRERPDLVHLHSRRGADTLGGIAAKLASVPAILSRRVDNPEPRWLVALKYRLYARVITISDGIRQVLLREGLPDEKIRCVPSAVDTERYRPDGDREWFRQELGIRDDQPVIGMIAQLIPRKGHEVLLDALPAVLAQLPDLQVLLFGKGPLQEPLAAEIAERGMSQTVRLMGFREDLERIIPCLDLVVHPAYMEGLGVALLQAAACGVPIVATRAGGIPEIVKPDYNGELIDPGDSVGLGRAIQRLLADRPLTAQMGRQGRALVEKNFSISSMVQGNLNVYRELAGRTK